MVSIEQHTIDSFIEMVSNNVYGKIEMQKKGSKSTEFGLGRVFKNA